MTVQPSAVSRNALVILAVIACGAVLYLLHGIFTPLALAVFLAVMIDGLARGIRRVAPVLPVASVLPVAILVSVGLFGVAAFIIADNATAFFSQLVDYTPRLNALIAQAAALAGVQVPPTVGQLFLELNPKQYLGELARGLQGFASDAIFVLIYLGFILASRRGFERKVMGLFPDRGERREATEAFLRIRNGVEQYLWVQTVTGLMIAVGSWIAMQVLGLQNAVFWAFLIFIASYIPIVGGVVGVAAPPLFALVEFPTIWPAVILLAVLQTIQFVVGNVIQPRMQSDSLNIDPVVVLLSLAFWGAIWGPVGMFLSTPLTVMAMVVLAQFEGARWVAVLLSADGQPLKSSDDDRPGQPARTPATPRRRPSARSSKRES
ncbi:MAG: AI-2E family transporter [Phenylobacterium sp.]|uniref:AI-2E family transporter n=1 Tax=Phenylobacterium sp. TaxID=1871053 RepID=UPI00391D97E9